MLKFRDWWLPVILGLAILIFLAFWAGAVSVTGVEPTNAPHGILEYWFERYQGTISSVFAFLGAGLIVVQLLETRRHHAANLRASFYPEIDALDVVERECRRLLAQTPKQIAETMGRHSGAKPRIHFISFQDFEEIRPKLPLAVSSGVKALIEEVKWASEAVTATTTEPESILGLYMVSMYWDAENVLGYVAKRRAQLEALILGEPTSFQPNPDTTA